MHKTSASVVGNTYLFTGRRYNLDTGLYYYRTRYYNSEVGRFLQVAPIGYVSGINSMRIFFSFLRTCPKIMSFHTNELKKIQIYINHSFLFKNIHNHHTINSLILFTRAFRSTGLSINADTL